MCDAIFVYKEEHINEILIDNSPVINVDKPIMKDLFLFHNLIPCRSIARVKWSMARTQSAS